MGMTYGEMGMIEGSNKIATLSSKFHKDRDIITNIIYLEMGKMCKTCGKTVS